MKSALASKINSKKVDEGDLLADAIIDLCFFTSYKIEELLKMPRKGLDLLIKRMYHHYGKNKGDKK